MVKCWVSCKQKLWLFFKRITAWYYHNTDKTSFHFSFSHSLEPCSESTLNSLHFCWFLPRVCVPPNYLNTLVPAPPSLIVEYDNISSQLSSETQSMQYHGLLRFHTLDNNKYSPDKASDQITDFCLLKSSFLYTGRWMCSLKCKASQFCSLLLHWPIMSRWADVLTSSSYFTLLCMLPYMCTLSVSAIYLIYFELFLWKYLLSSLFIVSVVFRLSSIELRLR